MADMTIPVPLTLEQIAFAIRQMGKRERSKLLELFIEQDAEVAISPRQQQKIEHSLSVLKQEVDQALNGQTIKDESILFDGLTLKRYLELTDGEQQQLLDQWSAEAAWFDAMGI